jgi:hypothetical protein
MQIDLISIVIKEVPAKINNIQTFTQIDLISIVIKEVPAKINNIKTFTHYKINVGGCGVNLTCYKTDFSLTSRRL